MAEKRCCLRWPVGCGGMWRVMEEVSRDERCLERFTFRFGEEGEGDR